MTVHDTSMNDLTLERSKHYSQYYGTTRTVLYVRRMRRFSLLALCIARLMANYPLYLSTEYWPFNPNYHVSHTETLATSTVCRGWETTAMRNVRTEVPNGVRGGAR